jgi:hypothetical protein
MSAGTELAAEIKEALAEASAAIGDGVLVGTISRKGSIVGGTAYAPTYGTPTLHTFNIVLGTFDEREREGTAIMATDAKVTCSVGDTVPVISDTILVDGVDYKLYGVTPVETGGVGLMFELWARR